MRLFLFLLISCTVSNDPYIPKLKKWTHFRSKMVDYQDTETLNYKFSFRFNTKREGNFFIELTSYNESRLTKEKKLKHYRQSLFGDFTLISGELVLKYLDTVAGFRNCQWAKDLIGVTEKIPFKYDSEDNIFITKLKDRTLTFVERGDHKLDEKYKETFDSEELENCKFFINNFKKGIFNSISQ